MARPRAAVTDTHPLLLYAAGSSRLGRGAAGLFSACERQEALLYVPAAVVWESSLLARAGRVNLRRSVRAFYEDLFSNPAFQPLDLSPEQVFLADEARPNADPFDALVCAAARSLDLPLITRDTAIAASRLVRVTW